MIHPTIGFYDLTNIPPPKKKTNLKNRINPQPHKMLRKLNFGYWSLHTHISHLKMSFWSVFIYLFKILCVSPFCSHSRNWKINWFCINLAFQFLFFPWGATYRPPGVTARWRISAG